MPAAPEVLVMAKPAGARCNLACGYCYYLAKAGQFPDQAPRMAPDLLESYIRQRLESSAGPVTAFEWHGGEPTLLGLEYFREIVALQRRHCPQGRSFSNGIQTNGTLLDEDWARFLRDERFSVGLSLDGPAACHDAYRPTRAGAPSHGAVLRAFGLLRRHGVHCDVLCVLHAGNVADPLGVYGFFRELGVTHLQFLPLVSASTRAVHPAAATPEALGAFLCAVFDQWIRQDVGRVVIQLFDEALRPALGLPHALCLFRETCGEVIVLEHEGSVYACDHFVDPAHRLGNLGERSLADLAADPRLRTFGLDKRESLPAACRRCEVLAWCHGGCPKDRIVATPAGEWIHYLCPAYRRFFRHCRPAMARLAAHWKAGLPLRDFAGRSQSRRPGTGRG